MHVCVHVCVCVCVCACVCDGVCVSHHQDVGLKAMRSFDDSNFGAFSAEVACLQLMG